MSTNGVSGNTPWITKTIQCAAGLPYVLKLTDTGDGAGRKAGVSYLHVLCRAGTLLQPYTSPDGSDPIAATIMPASPAVAGAGDISEFYEMTAGEFVEFGINHEVEEGTYRSSDVPASPILFTHLLIWCVANGNVKVKGL